MGLSDRERAFKFAMDHLYEPDGDYSTVVDALAAEFAAVRALARAAEQCMENEIKVLAEERTTLAQKLEAVRAGQARLTAQDVRKAAGGLEERKRDQRKEARS